MSSENDSKFELERLPLASDLKASRHGTRNQDLKDRRIATRYDKTARNFLATVLLAATRLWMRFESTT